MPGRINDHDIQVLRERADLGTVIGAYTSLTRAGTRLKGLCPFHSEKTPSFTVDPARGFFHCFGCGEGGDVYSFLQKVEALSFPEAVERLARVVGYDLRYEELTPGQRKALGRRTRLTQALSEAAAFYASRLREEDGAAVRDYLASRGLGDAEIIHFRLGWAPDAWDHLARHLIAGGFEPAEIIDAGLATQGRQGPVDRFRGRVIFPILDAGGRDVVAFGGRVLPGLTLRTAPRDGPPPKYINSPETQIYKKSRTLYALNWARVEVQRLQESLVVEGYMDVIGLHLAGVRHAVATCGTALTAEHFSLLERYAPRVVLALDADEAGYAAAERARGLAEQVGVREVGVLELPDGQDPGDLAAEGAEPVEQALKSVRTAVEFQITQLLRTAELSTPEGQVEAYRRTFPLLAGLGDRFLRYRYVRDVVAPAVRLSPDLIERELDQVVPVRPAVPAEQAAAPRRAHGAPGDVGSASPRDPQLALERDVLQTALQRPDLLPEAWAEVTGDDFRAPASRQLFAALRSAPSGRLDDILANLPDDDARRRVRALAASDLVVEPDQMQVAEIVADLRAAAVGRRLEEIRGELSQLNSRTDAGRQRELMRAQLELELRRRRLREGRIA
ncbi:MAG: DNA primase [Nitriliruptorales bacterium]|nr:DNA primase [Nitriliruptorales bacterium]